MQPTDFPDYDDDFAGMLAKIAEAAPGGAEDSSWKNDTCPSMTFNCAGMRLHLFCDYRVRMNREIREGPRFSLSLMDEDGGPVNTPTLIETDDFPSLVFWVGYTQLLHDCRQPEGAGA